MIVFTVSIHVWKFCYSGTFAQVKLAIHKATGRKFAVKIVDKERFKAKPKVVVSLEQEISILMSINHVSKPTGTGISSLLCNVRTTKISLFFFLREYKPCIISIHSVFDEQRYLYLVLELWVSYTLWFAWPYSVDAQIYILLPLYRLTPICSQRQRWRTLWFNRQELQIVGGRRTSYTLPTFPSSKGISHHIYLFISIIIRLLKEEEEEGMYVFFILRDYGWLIFIYFTTYISFA